MEQMKESKPAVNNLLNKALVSKKQTAGNLFPGPAGFPAPAHQPYPAGRSRAYNRSVRRAFYLKGIFRSRMIQDNGAVVAAGAIGLPFDIFRPAENEPFFAGKISAGRGFCWSSHRVRRG